MKILILCGSREEFRRYLAFGPTPGRDHEYKFARDWRDLNGYRGADQVVILPGFFRGHTANFRATDTLERLPVFLKELAPKPA